MSQFVITGEDTLTLYDRVFNDFSDQDISTLTFPNDLVTVKTGKNGNTIYSKNEAGNNGELVLRLLRGSSDDKFLSSKLAEVENKLVDAGLAEGEFTKRLGDGAGGVTRDVYTMKGGIINKKPEMKANADGDTEQGTVVYTVYFADAKRRPQ